MILKLVITFAAGMGAHQTKRLFDRNIPSAGWNFLTRVAFGDLAKLIALVWIYRDLKIDNSTERLVVSSLLTSGSFGGGVLAGYIADAVNSK